MTRWWLSWYESIPENGDTRPLVWPLSPAFLGYWESGETDEDAPRAMMVAWVVATTEAEAWAEVAKHWPGDPEHRFCDPCPDPPGSRFPWDDWMPPWRQP